MPSWRHHNFSRQNRWTKTYWPKNGCCHTTNIRILLLDTYSTPLFFYTSAYRTTIFRKTSTTQILCQPRDNCVLRSDKWMDWPVATTSREILKSHIWESHFNIGLNRDNVVLHKNQQIKQKLQSLFVPKNSEIIDIHPQAQRQDVGWEGPGGWETEKRVETFFPNYFV